MKTIALLAIYVGQLPGYLPLWLNSCAYSPDISFFLLTDDTESVPYKPSNVTIVKTGFADIRERLSRVIGFDAALTNSYKLCDYKPLFGAAFSDLVGGYDYWGHVDLDVFFGQVRNFLPPDFASYIRVFKRGHLSLYRNDEEGNSLYRLPNSYLDWRKVFQSPDYFHFDEVPGIGRTLIENGVAHYADNRCCADCNWRAPNLRLTEESLNESPQAFVFDRGRVLQYFRAGNETTSREFGYLHFQKRKLPRLDPAQWESVQQWVFTANGPIPELLDMHAAGVIEKLNPADYSHLFRVVQKKFKRTIKIVKHPQLPPPTLIAGAK